MARDKITVDLMLATKQAEREIARINRKLGDMGKTMGKAFGGTGAGGDKVRALGSGLSKATVKADEFSKSMEASNARVIAFGASAGLIMGIDRALKAMVSSALKVEKAMMDVNIVMNASTQQLEKFGKGMFKVAKETAQGFDVVAEAATELARQGLGTEKTLQRTKDALILTRLTGMKAADAVKTLTAAVNSFNKEGVTSAEVINRMAKVDAKFAVSSEDLAKSISRVGASAVSAGVSMNELMAITTAVQQRTARGGAVIGNAFKTIFTRIQRSEVQQKLANIGVATRDMQGHMLSGIKVLQNLAGNFDKLTKSQQSSISENVAGVFQVNILKAALSDLSQETSAYSGALRAANSATDDAYQKNEKLNQTLDSLVNKTLANLTQAGAALGGGAFGPAIENVLGTVNSIIDAFGDGGKLEKFGEGFGKDILTGIGRFIGGPGLIMATAVFAKLAMSLGKFAKLALMDVVGINTATKQRAALEKAVVATIQSEPALLKQVEKGTLDIVALEQRILNTLKLQTAERAKMQAYAAPVAGALYGRGARAGAKGATFKGRPGGASGFVPNFADAGSERAAAAAGGYTAGSIRTMSQPGAGTMMYNSAETVKRFPGMSQSAIMPPQGSPAGAGYRTAFGAAHGFDPYAASGFVPNFAGPALASMRAGKGVTLSRPAGGGGLRKGPGVTKGISKEYNEKQYYEALAAQGGHLQTSRIAMLVPHGKGGTGSGFSASGTSPYENFSGSFPVYEWTPAGLKSYGANSGDIPDISDNMLKAAAELTQDFAAKVKPPADPKVIKKDNTEARLKQTGGGSGALEGAAGAIFEAGMALALGIPVAAQDQGVKRGDFDVRPTSYGGSAPWKAMRASRTIFGGRKFSMADFKISSGTTSQKSFVGKMAKELIYGGSGAGLIKHSVEGRHDEKGGILKPLRKMKKFKANGFVPNFSPVTDAIGREMAAGVPASAIRVGNNPALRGAGNPGGVGVYNTIHEPAGLSQGIRRSQRSGIDPMMHGAASGFVPNYAGALLSGAWQGAKKFGASKAGQAAWGGTKMGIGMTGMGVMGQAEGMGGRVLGAGMAGMMGGPWMAAAGVGLQLLTEGITALTGSADDATDAIDDEVVAQASLAERAKAATEGFAGLNKALSATEFLSKKAAIMQSLGIKGGAVGGGMAGTPELKALAEAGPGGFGKALGAFQKRAATQETFGGVDYGPKETQRGTWMSDAGPFMKARTVLTGVDAQMTPDSWGLTGHLEDPTHIAAAKAREAKREAADKKAASSQRAYEDYREKVTPFETSWEGGYSSATTSRRTPSRDEGRKLEQMRRAAEGWGTTRDELYEKTKYNRMYGVNEATGESYGGNKATIKGVGEFYARKFMEDISAPGPEGELSPLSPTARYQAMAAQGGMTRVTPATTREGMMENVASLLDVDVKDFKGKVQEFSNFLTEGVKMGKISEEQREKALRNFLTTIVSSYQSQEEYKKSIDALNKVKKQEAKESDSLRKVFSDAVEAQEALKKFAHEVRLSTEQLARDITHRKKMTGLENTIAAALEGATMTRKEAIGGTRRRALDENLKVFGVGGESEQTAKKKFSKAIADGLAKQDFVKFAAGQGFTADTARKALNDLKDLQGLLTIGKGGEVTGIKEGTSREEIEGLRQSLLGLTGDKLVEGIIRPDDASSFKFLPETIKLLEGSVNNLDSAVIANADNLIKSNNQAEKKFEVDQKALELLYRINTAREAEQRAIDASVARLRLQDAKERMGKGQIGARGYAAAYSASLAKDVDERGVRKGDFGRAFKAGFVNEMGYEPKDMLDDWESGTRSVAQNMKSSFADAFQSISSGADTVQGALANMAQSILNSISSMSSQMFTNMMFSKMGWQGSQGGLVPGYAAGGVVRGGSGYKDDVPTMMQGGEFVIKKSSAQKIGYGKLNAINGYAEGGPTMGKMGMVAMGASALSGVIGSAMQPGAPKPLPSRDYGLGKGKYGHFGGADPDAGQVDTVTGGGGRAGVSLGKAFVHYRRDPETGRLISERARPTEGRFEVSRGLSLMGRLGEDDPQTARMFGKEQSMAKYQDYLETETASRKAQIDAVKRQKKQRLIGAYMNAAMMIGGAKWMQGQLPKAPMEGIGAGMDSLAGAAPEGLSLASGQELNWGASSLQNPYAGEGPRQGLEGLSLPGGALGGYMRHYANGGSASGTPAMVMGGEYIMSPETVRTYGSNFMHELNRGNAPSYANGGPVGGTSAGNQGPHSETLIGGNTTNNVKISVNIDKAGKADASADTGSGGGGGGEREDNEQANQSKEFGKILQGVVLDEIVKQQRPGGLLQGSPHTP